LITNVPQASLSEVPDSAAGVHLQVLRLEYRVEELTGELADSNTRMEEAQVEIERLTTAAEASEAALARVRF
jgi:hypothetical protein